MMDIVFVHFMLVSLAFVLCAHGLLLLTDSVYGDTVILEGMMQPEHVRYLQQSSTEHGRPLIGRILMATASIRNKKLFYRTIGVAGVWLMGVFTFAACRASGLMSDQACVVIALMATGYSCHQTLMDYSIALLYYGFQVFFLAGVTLVLLAVHASPLAGAGLCVVAVALLYLGFQMESLLSYYFGLPLLVGLAWLTNQPGYLWPGLIMVGAVSLYPFIHWWLKERLTPRGGALKDYNRFVIDAAVMKEHSLRVLTYGVIRAGVEPVRSLLARPLGWLVLVPAAGCGWALFGWDAAALHVSLFGSLSLIGLGLVFLALGGLPYVLVRQKVGVRGWETKNNVLLALPSALIWTGVISLFIQGPLFGAVLGFMLVFNAVYLAGTHLHWVAVWAKHRAVLQALSKLPGAESYSIFAYTDLHPVTGSSEQHNENYTLFLVYLLDRLWGGLRHMVIIEPKPKTEGYSALEIEIARQATTVDYMLKNIDREGAQAAITVEAGARSVHPVLAGLKYLWLMHRNPEEMTAFLESFTAVTITPLGSVEEHDESRGWADGVSWFVPRWRKPAEAVLQKEREQRKQREETA